MKILHLAAALLVATALHAAEARDDVLVAAKRLADAPNYTWKTVVVVPSDSQFRPGPTEGQTEKGGATHLALSFRDTKTEAIIHGDKGALTNEDGVWESLAELESAEGPGRFRAMMLRNFKLPAKQAQELVTGAKELKKVGDVIAGDLTADGATQFLTFARRPGGGSNPKVRNAAGSVKFWLTSEGAIAKFEFKIQGVVTINGDDREVDRTTTVEISKVGETKVAVPDGARKKLS